MDYQKYIEKSISYKEYISQIEELVNNNKTSGENQSIELSEYTKLNLRRMNRLNKTNVLNEEIHSVLKECKTPMIWLVLTEAWCGDAAQNIPYINLLADNSENIELGFLYRDESLELMDAFLTNGGRSIPKLIALNKETNELIGSWGPRPQETQERMKVLSQSPELKKEDIITEIQLWYARDKNQSIEKEFLELLKSWC